jgi:peroxiredoxin
MIAFLKSIILASLFVFMINPSKAQSVFKTGWYKASIQRPDAAEIIFTAELVQKNNKPLLYIRNAAEKLVVDDITVKGDSVFIDMPFFESWFKLKLNKDFSLTGKWIKGTSNKNLELPVVFTYGTKERFAVAEKPIAAITGRWQVTFTRPNGTERPAIAEFQQTNNYLTGTFLTPSGDYRFLEGVVNGSAIQLSCFDGSHAYLFTAQISNNEIVNGNFYSSASNVEKWRAVKNNNAALPDTVQRTALKPGETTLNFTFKDVNGKPVSINDAKYQNKVVVIQIMGSWCPNCMDESKFLSQFYRQYKTKGVEVLALAYEYSLDEKRSKTSIQKFIKRFNIQYPVLLAPATVSDEQKTEKTLPQLTPIKFFPTTIFIGKDGKVNKVHSGFYGPGTGAFYDQFKTDFYRTIQSLLAE